MPAMIDGSCQKCGKRFGWRGKVIDRPPCPKCGHQIPRDQLEADQKKMDEIEAEMLAEFEKEA